jgi:hypothetical protein
MATYKVLQDIEAEDTLIGPLTLRQCIYAAIAAINIYLCVVAFTRGASWMIFFFLPFIGIGVFFAFPWRKEQSTEIWALAKIRFALKPRKRIWDQSGVKHLVTVTAPKQLEDPRLRHMSETEVRSRLKALADTIDSRGWAVKNVPLNMYIQPTAAAASDRLVVPESLPREVPGIDLAHTEDMFDYANNPLAQQFDAKMTASSTAHREQIVNSMHNPDQAAPAAAADPANWYIAPPVAASMAAAPLPANIPGMSSMPAPAIPVAANPTADETALAEEIRQREALLHAPHEAAYPHLRTIQPLSAQAAHQYDQPVVAQDSAVQAPVTQPQAQPLPMPQPVMTTPATPVAATPPAPVTPPPNPAILELANNNDLNVATLAREAKHLNEQADEVVVSLH